MSRPAALVLALAYSCFGQTVTKPHPAAAFPGDWLQFRSDRKLTGHSRLVGSITPPTITSTSAGIPNPSTLPTISIGSVSVVLYVNTGANVQRADVTIQNISTSDGYSLPTFGFYFLHPLSTTQFTLNFSPSDPDLADVTALTLNVAFQADTSALTVSATDISSLPTPLQRLIFAVTANLASVFQNPAQVNTTPGTATDPVWTITQVASYAASFSNVFFQPGPVLWSLFLGARQTSIAFQASTGSAGSINLPAVDANVGALAANSTWGIGPPTYDLNQNGNPITFPIIDPQSKIGNFVAGSSSFQEVQFDSCYSTNGNVTPTCGYGHFYQWQGGNWVQQWETAGIPLLFSPNTIVGDFDGDGKLEVAMEPWWNINVYDLLTGTPKTSARASPNDVLTGREYGWLGAYDLNGGGVEEFVVIGLFENFLAVMGWQNGQLVKLWDHTIEIVHDLAKTIHSCTTYPVQDIDGDGKLDVVTSIYNETGDGQWHVVARDGMTGNVLVDMPGRFLLGMTDVNGDGASEMFTIATSGQLVPAYGQVDVMSFQGKKLTTLLELTGEGLATQTYNNLPLNINSGNVLSDVVAGPVTKGGLPVFFTQQLLDVTQGTIEVTAWQWTNGAIAELGTITGPNLQVLATQPAAPGSPGFLISSAINGNVASTLSVSGVSGTIAQSSEMDAPLSSAVVGHLKPGDPPTVIVQNALQEMVAFQPSSTSGGATVLWTHAGRGGYTGADDTTGEYQYSGPLLASLAGDGTLQTVVATVGPSGQARIAAIQPDGSEFWDSDLNSYPGAPAPPDEAGLTLFFAGRLRYSNREDILATTRSETIASDQLNLLDGSTGQLVWTDPNGSTPGTITPPTHDSPGEQWFATYDWNQSGLDDVIGTSSYTYWVKNGADANLINKYFTFPTPTSTTGMVFQPDATWTNGFSPTGGVPVIADFLNNGTDTILYGGSTGLLGLFDPASGMGVWQGPAMSGTPGYLQGIADLDGDGTLSLVSADEIGPNGASTLKVYQASTGQVLWSIPLPGCGPSVYAVPSISVGDINGDGRDEAVFTCGTTIYVVGANPGNRSGKILWSLNLGTYLDTPILADPEGTGRLEIVVVGSDGYVYGIGSQPSNAPPATNAPAIAANGVVEGATFKPGQIAPGGWFTILGTNLASAMYQASATPLPQQLGGTVVIVNGQIARVDYVDSAQINAQMPPDMPIGPATVMVNTGAGSSKTVNVQIVPAIPEIFQYGTNRAVAQNLPDYSLNGPTNAIAPGGNLVVYFTGGGLVNGDIRAGVPAPLTTLLPLQLPTTVLIGGQQAKVAFSGLTPGSIGLYQVNATVPLDLSAGDYPVTINIGGITSSSALISVK